MNKKFARRRREAAMAAVVPVRQPCRTSFDNILPWERPGFILRPPPVPVNIDALPPLEVKEFVTILRRLMYDPENRRGEGVDGRIQRHIPVKTIAKACGYSYRTLRNIVEYGGATKRARSKMSPLLRKIEAGRIRYDLSKKEFVDVLDPALPKTKMQQGVYRRLRRGCLS